MIQQYPKVFNKTKTPEETRKKIEEDVNLSATIRMIESDETPHRLVRISGAKSTAAAYKKVLEDAENSSFQKEINKHIKPVLEYIPLNKLTPLESQRHSEINWAVKVLKSQGGLDWIALGALSVAKDENGRYWVWNGCGRWLLVGVAGLPNTTEVPCLVFNMEPEQAAKYFSFTQQEGVRKLPREVTFINAWAAKDVDALKTEALLDYLGVYIQGTTDFPVPRTGKQSNTYEIGFRTVDEGYHKIAKQDRNLMRQAIDIVIQALKSNGKPIGILQQDIVWAILQSLVFFPVLRANQPNTELQGWLDSLFALDTVATIKKEWKSDIKGLTGNVGAARLLSYNLLLSFKKSNKISEYTKTQLRNIEKTCGISTKP